MIIVLICPVVSQHNWFRLHLTSSHGQEVGKQLRWEIDLNSSHGGPNGGPVGPGCCWRPKQVVEVCWEMEFFYGEYCDLIGWFNVQSPYWLMISLGILLTNILGIITRNEGNTVMKRYKGTAEDYFEHCPYELNMLTCIDLLKLVFEEILALLLSCTRCASLCGGVGIRL